jgi:tetratricopeptide (TPR) repeat protein
MNPERLDRLKEILHEAAAVPPADRRAFLECACGGDTGLRAEVESLLAHEGRASLPAVEGPGGRAHLPERIGPYRVIEVLGEGGMGTVYRADQAEPFRREVAVKLLRGGLDSAGVAARFEAERRTLALMDHPNIARVLDAGSDEAGRPYFVMELVRGRTITEFCKAGPLDVRRRLGLFLQVCRAVRHAHRRGIIHRDLKPSNILVAAEGGEPVPKVIDFGIAKALHEPLLGTDFRTRPGQLVGTLEYMSPEQARGDVAALDTRTDVYALGVILYELLAGRLPLELGGAPLHEAVRRICEEPPRPLRVAATTASGRIDADLSTITDKCLEKDPDRRYGSAADLTEDLERYIESRPILARPPSAAYVARKLIRRHRVPFAFAALIVAFLAVYAATVSVQLRMQTHERARAEAEARKAERINAFLQEMLSSAAPGREGRDVRVKEVLDAAAARIGGRLEDEPEVAADVRETMGSVYLDLGLNDEAEPLLRAALELRREHLGAAHPDTAEAHRQMANLRHFQGRQDEAEAEILRALEIVRSATGSPPLLLARILNTQGLVLRAKGKSRESESSFREALDLHRANPGEKGPEEATVAENLAGALLGRGAHREAEDLVRLALAEKRKADGGRGAATATSLHNLAFILAAQGKHEEAVPLYREALDIDRAVKGERHPEVASTLLSLGDGLAALGRLEEAEGALREAVAIRREIGAETPPHGAALTSLARVVHLRGRASEAERLAREAKGILAAVPGGRRPGLAAAASILGAALEAKGRHEEAEAEFRATAALREEILPAGHPLRASAACDLGSFLIRRGRHQEAESLVDQALALWRRESGDPHPDHPLGLAALGNVRLAQGRPAEAEPLYLEALEGLTRRHGREHLAVAQVLHDRARCLRALGRHAEALESAREALAVRRKVLGDAHPRVAESSLEATLALDALGRREEAAAAAGEALRAFEGSEHADPEAVTRARAVLRGLRRPGA